MYKNYRNLLWGYAVLLTITAYISGLFIDLTGDSGLYAAISRQMTESGDWLNLSINGKPYDQKPHLFFWLAGFGITLFDNTNFAFKLFPFLFGLSSIWFIYRHAKLLFSIEAGRFAALIAGTTQIFFLYFLDIHTDTVLQAGVALALWQLTLYLKTKKPGSFFLGFTGIGLAMLTKGPIGAVLPSLFVLFYLLQSKDYRQLLNPKWLPGVLLVFLIISPTLYHLYKSFGWEGLRFYFIDNNIGRITGEVAGSNTDPLFYLYNIVWAFLPWTILLFIVIFFEIRNMAKGVSRDASKTGLLGSVLVLFIVLSSAKGKVPNYMMMMVAPLAVVISGWSQYILKLPQKLLRGLIVAQSILLIMISVLLLITLYLFIDDFDRLPLVLVLISCVAIYFVARLKDNSLVKIVLSSVIITATVNLYFNTVVIPELYSYQGCRKVLDIFEEKRQKEDILYNFEVEEYELFYYADDNVVNISNWEELYEAMEKPDSWIYTNMIKYNDVLNMDYPVDTVYEIRQRGMNRITLEFLNPLTREESLITNYLIKTGDKRDSRTE